MTDLASEYLVLWASQTGNAERIAKNIHTQARRRGFTGQCISMENYESAPLEKASILILVTSNTGDGDPPDSSIKFWHFLRNKCGPTFFSKTRFTVLGLGDSNYSNYNATGRKLEKQMEELGGTIFYPKALADASEGLEDTVDPWVEKLWEVLPTVLERNENVSLDQLEEDLSELQINQVDIPYSMEYRIFNLPNGVDKYLNLENTLVDNYTMDARREKLPSEVLKYVSLENSLIDNDDNEPEYKAFPFQVCLNDLVPGAKLTGLPRVSAPTAKLVPVEGQTVHQVSTNKVPEFVSTPVPITYAPVTMVCCLTTSDAVKRTLEVELDIGKDGHFEPGDAFGIFAPNNEQLVQAILTRLNAPKDLYYKLEGENLPSHLQKASRVTLADLLRYGVDLTRQPRKALFRMLADYTSDPTEKLSLMYLASKQGVSAFNAIRAESPNLLDILCSFPTAQPPIDRLLDLLPAHLPRFYSISSSPLKRPGKIRFAFNIVEYITTAAAHRQGVATPWLDKITELVPSRSTPDKLEIPVTSKEIKVPMYIRPNANAFILPDDTKKPLVLIGPGTGIAPFIGFLEHRQTQRAQGMQLGPIYVYYGYRNRSKDFLFREELEQFEKDGTVTQLALAESRASDGSPKVYVQNLICRDKGVLYDLLVKKNGAVYLCGDAKGMAKGVQDALADMLVEYHNVDVDEANKLLMQWVTDKKYLRDLVNNWFTNVSFETY